MAIFLYTIFLSLFRAATLVASIFDTKAKKWVQGRRRIFENLQKAIAPTDQVIWMHCASLGEFEQGRPLLETLKQKYPRYKILLTFFSPSGFEVQKDYAHADWVFYLPMDGPRNAKRFLEIAHPSLVIFVKYEFWYYYLKKIKYRHIPLLLVSALFREDMSFFAWYGGLQRKMLSRFDHLFVQNAASKKLVDELGLELICSISGDTRFDRVIEIAGKFEPLPQVERFCGKSPVIVAGSTWPDDEEVLQKASLPVKTMNLKLILAPHEINKDRLEQVRKRFPGAIFYSEAAGIRDLSPHNVMIIDNYGMLSRLYYYARVAYVGGALAAKGVHNVLEAAVYHKPVLFGPYYTKYSEAVELIQCGGAISFNHPGGENMLQELIRGLLTNQDEYADISKAAGDYVYSNGGATQVVLHYIEEKRLLTS